MKPTSIRPKQLWTRNAPTVSFNRYVSAHQGEFRLNHMKSRFSYSGRAWAEFRELPTINPYEGYHRFAEGATAGCWTLIRDKIRNNLTADLLSAAEILSEKVATQSTQGPARGYGIDSREVWVGLLDGGVGVEVHIGQDEDTNQPEGWQRTTLRGPRAFRAILELLGFDWIEQKLTGEEEAPIHDEVKDLVDTLLRSSPPNSRNDDQTND